MVDRIFDCLEGADDTLIVGDVFLFVEWNIEVNLQHQLEVVKQFLFRYTNQQWQRRLTRMRTLLPLTSTSVMASLLESDMIQYFAEMYSSVSGKWSRSRSGSAAKSSLEG